MTHRGQRWQNAKIRKSSISRERFVVRRRCLVILIGLETAFDVMWSTRICVGKIRKYEMVKCEILKIAIYLVNITVVDEKVKPLIGNRGRSFRIRHFQQPTTTSSGCSIDDVTSGMWTNANYRKTDPRMHRWALTQRVRWASSCVACWRACESIHLAIAYYRMKGW